MTKQELVNQIADKAGLTKKQAEAALGAFTDIVSQALAAGDQVNLLGFGGFKVSARGERQGRNPRTGEAITIPASKSVKFNLGKGLKDKLNLL